MIKEKRVKLSLANLSPMTSVRAQYKSKMGVMIYCFASLSTTKYIIIFIIFTPNMQRGHFETSNLLDFE